jgi:hypothetical protein
MGDGPSLLWQADAKVQWARSGQDAVERMLAQYLEQGGVHLEQAFDEATGLRSLTLVAEPLPVQIPLSIGTAVHSLRSALDTAVSALMFRARGREDARENFPVHETERELRNSFADGHRTCPDCHTTRPTRGKNASIREHFPDLERVILDEFRPWRDGNFPLWAISKLDNIHKHRMILPILADVSWSNAGFFSINPQGGGQWNVGCTYSLSPGSTMLLARNSNQLSITEQGVFTASLAFPDGIPLAGQPVIPALANLIVLVTNIIDTLKSRFD